jgi:hypothetical protein
MKRTLSLVSAAAACLLISTQATATTCGPYIGIGGGKSWVKTPDSNIFQVIPGGSSSHTLSGFGARAFFGFNVNKYVGFEGGYTRYARSNYTGNETGDSANLRFYPRTYDAVLKAYLPLGYSGFNIYALGGLARVVETVKYNNPSFIPANNKIALPAGNTTHGYNNRPIYGLGVNYNFGKHVTINAEITQIERLNSFGTTPTAVPYLNLASANIAYNFG